MAQKNLNRIAERFFWKQDAPKEHADLIQLLVDFALEFGTELLKEAAHTAKQQLLLEEVEPVIADDVHDTITDALNPYL